MSINFNTISSGKKRTPAEQLSHWLKRQLIGYRLNSPLGYVFLILASLAISVLVGYLGFKIGVMLLGLIVGVPILISSIFNLRFGLIVVFVVSFFLLAISRMNPEIPLGIILDAFVAVMFFGLMIQQIGSTDWRFIRNPVSWLVIVWIVYNFMMVANPAAASRLAWLYTIRSIAGLLLVYFITIKAVNSLNFVSMFFKIWIVLALLAALYGLKQEFLGFSDAELKWILSSEERFKLFFNWGKFRRFSFFSDPTVFGILMAYSSLLCIVLLTGKIKIWQKVALALAAGTMLLAMVFTGTRTAFATVPVGIVFFTVITLRRNIMIGVGICMLMAAGVIYLPISSLGPLDSNSLNRIRSAFIGEEDPSYRVRQKNQEYIQPYIHSHPIGGGLGSVGVWGQRFSPDSPISQFPPDSGFVRVAVEQGWIGLVLYMALLFVLFRYGIRQYLLCEHPKVRLFYVAILTVLFSLVVANYPQQSFAIFPTIIVFYICMGIVVRLKDFDEEEMHALTGGIKKID